MMDIWTKIWPNFWNERTGREKGLIGMALGLLAVLVLWFLVYKPISEYPAKQSRTYAQAELDLKIMQKGQFVIQGQSNGVAKTVTTLSVDQFPSTITKAAKDHNLLITRRQPKGYEELTLWLDSVDGKSFYTWVDVLTGGYNIVLTKAQIYHNDESNVRVQVTFKLAETS